MKRIKNFLVSSSFVVLLSGASIANAAMNNPASSGYGEAITVTESQKENSVKTKQKRIVGKKNIESQLGNRYEKKMNYKKKALKN